MAGGNSIFVSSEEPHAVGAEDHPQERLGHRQARHHQLGPGEVRLEDHGRLDLVDLVAGRLEGASRDAHAFGDVGIGLAAERFWHQRDALGARRSAERRVDALRVPVVRTHDGAQSESHVGHGAR